MGRSREFRSLGVLLGYRYEASPVIASEPGPWPPSNRPSTKPTASPRPPRLARRRPLALTIPARLHVIAFGEQPRSRPRLRSRASRRGGHRRPPTTVRFDNARLATLYEAPLALIRPDQHVAWRGSAWPGKALVRMVTGEA